jgi:hypothetical protein
MLKGSHDALDCSRLQVRGLLTMSHHPTFAIPLLPIRKPHCWLGAHQADPLLVKYSHAYGMQPCGAARLVFIRASTILGCARGVRKTQAGQTPARPVEQTRPLHPRCRSENRLAIKSMRGSLRVEQADSVGRISGRLLTLVVFGD